MTDLKRTRRLAITLAAALALDAPARASAQATVAPAPPAAVTPFRIAVPDATLRDLQERLARTRLADPLEGAGWDYGIDAAYLRSLLAYWRQGFDWRQQERALNQAPQFTTTIDGLRVHFVHQRSPVPTARPLLLLNGWPSSFAEYVRVLGPLTDPVRFGGRTEDAFHVIVPSMPGYGFSDKPRVRGFGNTDTARLWASLMARLGFRRYAIVGTDIGIGVGSELATLDQAHVFGLHLAGCPGVTATPPPGAPGTDTQAYFDLQATKPETIGASLSDSPAGLAAWIAEKYHGWTDHTGDLEPVMPRDQLLTTVMLYWVTNSGPSSARIYYERRHQAAAPLPRVTVPTACTAWDVRYDQRPRATARNAATDARYTVARWTTMARGGHFPAFEQPADWLADVRSFLATLR